MRSAAGGALAALAGLPACGRVADAGGAGRGRVIVLGIDGMSPVLLEKYVAAGRMPNFAGLIRHGDFKPLRSSIPPQSPVAWSNFITGMNPGVHGIFDFIHRDPATLTPYLSTSRAFPPTSEMSLGDWRIPLSGGGMRLLRRGPAFWKLLSERDVPCVLYRLPANFPPVECSARTISGLGTPDMLGAYGVSSYVTDVEPPNREKITDSHVTVVDMSGHRCEAALVGPGNVFRAESPSVRVGFTVVRDPVNSVLRITVQGKQILLKQGEWSDWVTVEFSLVPHLKGVTGTCRFFAKEVHPHFKLYASPVNIDPASPALPISTPPDFSAELARRIGPYYTQGIAEDTKALSSGIFSEEDYLRQAMHVLDEDMAAYDYLLGSYEGGLLFFYFSTIDLNSHVHWRSMDPRHPLYTPELGEQFGKTIEDLYVRMDGVLGKALERVDDDTTLIVLSDHGFNPFYRTFSLNGWLLENDYARLRDPGRRGELKLFANTDWNGTYAYGLGINGLYLNVRGREKAGVVGRGRQSDALLDEIARGLEDVSDPATGERVIARAYRKEEVYRGEAAEDAPDIIVGFNRGYRASWGTILGTYEADVIADNDDKWSGDHCMDVAGLSGVLLSNRKITADAPALVDMAPTILARYGVEAPPGTEGRNVLG